MIDKLCFPIHNKSLKMHEKRLKSKLLPSQLYIEKVSYTCCFSIRKVIHWVVTKKVFDNFIMLVIVMSSVAIAAKDLVDEDNPRNFYLGKSDCIFTLRFAFEVCLKVRIFVFGIYLEICQITKSMPYLDFGPRFHFLSSIIHAWLLERDGYHRGVLLNGLILPHHSVSDIHLKIPIKLHKTFVNQ